MTVSRPSLALALTMLVLAPAAQAWGPLGHSLVAELAQRHLSPVAAPEVDRPLAPEPPQRLASGAHVPAQAQDGPARAALAKQPPNPTTPYEQTTQGETRR